MENKTEGALLVERLEAWFTSYLYLRDSGIGLTLALWSIGSWCFDKFFTWPYLSVTAATPQAGKTTVLYLLEKVCQGASLQTAVRPFSLLTSIKARDGKMTLLFDESEDTGSEAKTFMSQVLNNGYTKGGTIERASGAELNVFPVYCPKAFAQIGDMNATMRDRSIVLAFSRGYPERMYDPEEATEEGKELQAAIKLVLAGCAATGKPSREVLRMFANPRDAQIWASMFGLANWLGVTAEQRKRLVEFAAENAMDKTAPKRRAFSTEDTEAAVEDTYSRKALADAIACFGKGETWLESDVLLSRLLALPTGGWGRYLGKGLEPIRMAGLLSRFGVKADQKNLGRDRGGKVINRRGWYRAKLVAAAERNGIAL